ncbi:hypothetical protein D1872_348170 [compost metagenome]
MRRHPHIQRDDAGGREEGHLFATPVVIAITAALVIPQESVYGGTAIVGFLTE